MAFQIEVIPHTLQFRFEARTSRGALQEHQVYFLRLGDPAEPGLYGIGECAPLPGLSPEASPTFENYLQETIRALNQQLTSTTINSLDSVIKAFILKVPSSVAFGLETAWLDFKAGGKKVLFSNEFTRQEQGLPINGLIWMGDKDFMENQIKKKLTEGFSCLKLKIGGLDFQTELEILKTIRKTASAGELTIRCDANGAFSPEEALTKLEKMGAFGIHSIEQPIRPGQMEAMATLCRESPIPIALDEELIGIDGIGAKTSLLEVIAPPFIILKPTLAGGLASCREWIQLTEKRNIKWWMTSALESNIGLNAISQFTANYPVQMEQGLGTGQLYHNNIPSPLTIRQGQLYYDQQREWGIGKW